MFKIFGVIYLLVGLTTASIALNSYLCGREYDSLSSLEITTARQLFLVSAVAWPYYLPKMITSYNEKKQFCIK